jgi:hypothetical protein
VGTLFLNNQGIRGVIPAVLRLKKAALKDWYITEMPEYSLAREKLLCLID